ncbi:hypothetical protein M8494_25595 [Serratia ureilytica]
MKFGTGCCQTAALKPAIKDLPMPQPERDARRSAAGVRAQLLQDGVYPAAAAAWGRRRRTR